MSQYDEEQKKLFLSGIIRPPRVSRYMVLNWEVFVVGERRQVSTWLNLDCRTRLDSVCDKSATLRSLSFFDGLKTKRRVFDIERLRAVERKRIIDLFQYRHKRLFKPKSLVLHTKRYP